MKFLFQIIFVAFAVRVIFAFIVSISDHFGPQTALIVLFSSLVAIVTIAVNTLNEV